jgi:nitrous oxidase accessory protein
MKRYPVFLFAFCLLAELAFLCGVRPARAAAPGDGSLLIVSPAGPFFTIQDALQAARQGAVIKVLPGIYSGPLVVDQSVTLEGNGLPVIDGGGQGTVVTLAAPGIVFTGFLVRGSGVEPDRDHAGITVTAPGVTVTGNQLEDVLFGIFVAEADRVVLRGNEIASKPQFEQGRKGDAIRIWYSQEATVIGNHVHDARDVVIWYSRNLILRENQIENGRYGVHLMYCDGAQIEKNRLKDNSVGVYVMYSKDVALRDNDIRGHHGSSGYGVGFKDADNAQVSENLLVDNHVGIFLDGTPNSPQGYARFEANIFAYNDIAVSLMPAVQRAEFRRNTFWENSEQMAIQGGGQGQNTWAGNYWSDYTGFDAQGDGLGDIPYHADRLFESLTDREPLLRVLSYSPAGQAVEMAAEAFPIFQPRPKLSDAAPSMQPGRLPTWAASRPAGRSRMILAAILILGAGLALGLVGLDLPGRTALRLHQHSNPDLEVFPWKAK